MSHHDDIFWAPIPGTPKIIGGDASLTAAVESGSCERVRAIFDRAFWRNEKIVPRWEHLRIALLREDKPMMRLLVTWGARAPENAAQLEGIPAQKLASYTRILAGYGLNMAVLEAVVGTDIMTSQPLPAPTESKGLEIGQSVPGQGIYVGQYSPKDRDGKSLRKTFNVFAAPQDLPDTMKYVDAVKHIAKLKGWNGFDGTNYRNDKKIYKALKDGSYNGGWIIPTCDILRGKDVDSKETTPHNLFDHQNKGAFKGTFETVALGDGYDYPDRYWSSTEGRGHSSYVRSVRFSDGLEDWGRKGYHRFSCRPVRLVACKAP
ncbi:MAG: hypothetical protein HY052_09970 [Proteobacteria bacterium]|nr:hypothetical protein [Pseudomonadota bacterium]